MTTFAPHTLTSDELDALATDLARRVAAGRLPEREARMTILEAVHRSQIIPTETLKWCRRNGIAPHLHDDMVHAATDFYTRKILDLPNDPGSQDSTGRNGRKFFDLRQFVGGASAAGSIRQALANHTLMFSTLFRSVNRVHSRVVVSTDLLQGNLEDDSTLRYLESLLPVAEDDVAEQVVDAGRSERIGALTDLHSAAVNGQRGANRTRIDAAFLRRAFDLPALERPLDPRTRWTMLGWLGEDPELAYRSITAFFIPDDDPRLTELGALWLSYGDEHLEAITGLTMGRRVADLLARDALADRPRPGKPALSRLRSTVRSAVAGCGVDAQWATRLVETYVDHEHEERSAWDADRGTAGVVRDPEAYLRTLTEASALPGSPLGSSPAEVRRTLEEKLEEARAATTRRRNRRRAG